MPELVYADELVQLFLGDYRDADLSDLDATAIITDPPYGETSLDWDRWPSGWLDDACALAPALWCFGSMRMFLEHGDEFTQAGYRFAQDLVWEKHNGSGLAADRFRRVHEIATHWYHGEWADVKHKTPTTADASPRIVRRRESKGEHQGSRGANSYVSEDGGPRLMRSVIPVRSEHGRAVHPTQKPVGIVAPLIEYSTERGDLVLDLFGGSGTTALAARALGRRCVIFEAREDYATSAAKRLSQQTFDLEGLSA